MPTDDLAGELDRGAPARGGDRTPPVIVAGAPAPEVALQIFIAQELEHWGFEVKPGPVSGLYVPLDGGRVLYVQILDATAPLEPPG